MATVLKLTLGCEHFWPEVGESHPWFQSFPRSISVSGPLSGDVRPVSQPSWFRRKLGKLSNRHRRKRFGKSPVPRNINRLSSVNTSPTAPARADPRHTEADQCVRGLDSNQSNVRQVVIHTKRK